MEEHVIDEGVDLERLVNGEHAAAPRRGRGRQRKDSVAPESQPQGLVFHSDFEANMFADEIETRANSLEQESPDDGRAKRIVKLLRDKAQELRDQHQS